MPYFDVTFLYWVLNSNMLRRRIIPCFLCIIKWSPGKWFFFPQSSPKFWLPPHTHPPPLFSSDYCQPCPLPLLVRMWATECQHGAPGLKPQPASVHPSSGSNVTTVPHGDPELAVFTGDQPGKKNQTCSWILRNIKNKVLLKSHRLWEDRGGKV